MSGGFEALSQNFDARLNWYGPVTAPRAGVAGFAQVQLEGPRIFMTGGHEVALRGVDAEVGTRLPLEYANLDPNLFELRAYAGAYYFDHDQAVGNVAGVKGRLELRINDVLPAVPGTRLTAEYEVSHDDYRSTRHEIGMRVRIPLGSTATPPRALSSLTGQERRMLDGIERDTDIVTVRSKAEPVADHLTGVRFDRVAYAGTGASVTSTSAQAGANTLVVLNGTITGGQTLQGNQTLIGGGTTINVRGLRSGLVLPVTAPGAAGRLTSPALNDDNLILDGSNIHVAGLTIVGSGPAGIGDGVDVTSNRTNVFLIGLTISNTGGDGIDIDDNNQVTITNLFTANTDESGIDITDNNRVTVTGATINNAGSDGIQINDGNILTFASITINNSQDDGFEIDDNNVIIITNSMITNPGGDGLQADGRNTLTLTNLHVSNSAGNGLLFNDNNTVVITGGSVTNPGSDGIEMEDGNTVTMTGLTITNMRNGSDGIDIDDRNTVTLTNVTITGPNGDDAIEVDDNNTLTVINSFISNIDYGIYAEGNSSTISVSGTTFSQIGTTIILVDGNNNSLRLLNAVFNAAGTDVLRINAPTTLFVAANTFSGRIGDDVFDFNSAVTVISGSIANINRATIADRLCQSAIGSFTGTIAFADGTVLQDNVGPSCN